MFTKIRNRLTMQYAIVMMLLMMAFIIASSTGLLWVLYQEETQDLQSFVEEEAKKQTAIYQEKNVFFQLPNKPEGIERGSKIFNYVFDTNKQVVAAAEPAATIRDSVVSLIHKWDAADGEVKVRRMRLADGSRAVFTLCKMNIYDGAQIVGTVFVGEDISEYYHMLKNLLMIMVLLSIVFLIIAAVAGHLLAGKAMVPIKQAFFRQREFAADASHELRTPLSVLQLSIEAVQNDNEQQLSLFSTQVLDDMKSEMRRMTGLVTDLLTLARADAGATNIIKANFDVAALTETLIRSVQPLAAAKAVELELHSEQTLPITADCERINQLLLILVDNAIKHTPAGGKVAVTLAKTLTPRPLVILTVHDMGAGISTSDQKRIFERFYRVDKTRARQEGGAGLGLAIAKWIVDVHDGTIKVESSPGQGSRFIVMFPA